MEQKTLQEQINDARGSILEILFGSGEVATVVEKEAAKELFDTFFRSKEKCIECYNTGMEVGKQMERDRAAQAQKQ